MVQAFNPNSWEAEARGSLLVQASLVLRVPGQLGLKRPCLEQTKQEKKRERETKLLENSIHTLFGYTEPLEHKQSKVISVINLTLTFPFT